MVLDHLAIQPGRLSSAFPNIDAPRGPLDVLRPPQPRHAEHGGTRHAGSSQTARRGRATAPVFCSAALPEPAPPWHATLPAASTLARSVSGMRMRMRMRLWPGVLVLMARRRPRNLNRLNRFTNDDTQHIGQFRRVPSSGPIANSLHRE